MIECILENMGDLILPVTIIVLVALAFYTFIFTLVVMCLVSVTRYFGTAGKEQKLIRMEVGKIAEEVHLLRQELKGDKDSGSSTE